MSKDEGLFMAKAPTNVEDLRRFNLYGTLSYRVGPRIVSSRYI